jgi:hypothetical protein
MTAQEVLRIVEQSGGRLTPNGDQLTVEAPAPLPDALMALIRAHKPALVSLLQQPIVDTSCTPPDGLRTLTGADGTRWHVLLYRCPRCGGTNWGPRLDDPDTWCCLDCHPLQASQTCPRCGDTTRWPTTDGPDVCATCYLAARQQAAGSP